MIAKDPRNSNGSGGMVSLASWVSRATSRSRSKRSNASTKRSMAAASAGDFGSGTSSGRRSGRRPARARISALLTAAAVIERFVDAFERFDLDRLVTLLTQDARLTMPPEPVEFRGPQAIAGFLRESHIWGQEHKLIPTRANGQPALVFYLADPCAPIWRASSFVVLTLRGNQVSEITRFGDRGLLARFGLPRTLPRD